MNCRHDNKISYFIGGFLTHTGCFLNLTVVYINNSQHFADPLEQLFLLCLPKSITTLEVSYSYQRLARIFDAAVPRVLWKVAHSIS